jgi:hypothetical protein
LEVSTFFWHFKIIFDVGHLFKGLSLHLMMKIMKKSFRGAFPQLSLNASGLNREIGSGTIYSSPQKLW